MTGTLSQYQIKLVEAVKELWDIGEEEIQTGLQEFEAVHKKLLVFSKKPATADKTLAAAEYLATRFSKPDVVLETGVWWGVSTAFILTALQKNKKGKLHSIDFPPLDPTLRIEVGSAVPDEIKQPWELHFGASGEIIPQIIANEKQLDLFIHDSDHMYRNMMMEYNAIWPHLNDGGVIVADDIHTNNAFIEFSLKVNRKPFVIPRDKGGFIGLLKK